MAKIGRGEVIKGVLINGEGGRGRGGGRNCLLVTSLIDNNFCLFYIYFQPFKTNGFNLHMLLFFKP